MSVCWSYRCATRELQYVIVHDQHARCSEPYRVQSPAVYPKYEACLGLRGERGNHNTLKPKGNQAHHCLHGDGKEVVSFATTVW